MTSCGMPSEKYSDIIFGRDFRDFLAIGKCPPWARPKRTSGTDQRIRGEEALRIERGRDHGNIRSASAPSRTKRLATPFCTSCELPEK